MLNTRQQNEPQSKPADRSGKETLAQRVWQFSWDDYFPHQLPGSNVTVQQSNFREAGEFARRNFQQIYRADPKRSRFLWFEEGDAKERYYQTAGDFFAFVSDDKIVGTFVGTTTDWSSYYLRNASLLPTNQGKGSYQKFLSYFLSILDSIGVHRAEGDIAPSHHAHLHVLSKLGFNVTGLNNSERWGALLHLTRFLNPHCEAVFLRQFCDGNHLPKPSLTPKVPT